MGHPPASKSNMAFVAIEGEVEHSKSSFKDNPPNKK